MRVNLTIQASLVVIGSNGLYFTPSGQSDKTKLDPPASQPLNTGDSFVIRKKLFKFEYPVSDIIQSEILSPSITGTPVRKAATPAKGLSTATLTPTRRRASHRLSLVPAGKQFVSLSPMKRRQSNAGPAGNTPKRSHLSSRTEQEDEEEEIMDGIVDVQQSEDGEMIVLESREHAPETAKTVSAMHCIVIAQS